MQRALPVLQLEFECGRRGCCEQTAVSMHSSLGATCGSGGEEHHCRVARRHRRQATQSRCRSEQLRIGAEYLLRRTFIQAKDMFDAGSLQGVAMPSNRRSLRGADDQNLGTDLLERHICVLPG